MKSRLTIIVAAVVVAGFVACAAWALGLFEPRYGGAPASKYLHNIVGQVRFGGTEDKQKVLAVPSHVGVPILIRFTKAQDPRWRGWYQRFYPKLPQFVVRRLGPPKSNAGIVLKAIHALGYYGADAHEAVPQLLKVEADANAQTLPYSQLIQRAAVDALGDIGPGASNAIPMLITHLQSRSHVGGMARAMAKIDLRGERAGAILVPLLPGFEMVLGTNRFVQHNGELEALAAMAVHEPKWIQEIWRATENTLSSSSGTTAAFVPRAFACLYRLNALDASRVKVICGHSEHSESAVRRSIAAAIAFATGHAAITMPVLLNLQTDPDASVRATACGTLLRYAQSTNVDTQLRVTAVRSVLSCDDDGNKWQALAVAQGLGPVAVPALGETVPLLLERTHSRQSGRNYHRA